MEDQSADLKRSKLYQDWQDQVFHPIQDNVAQSLDSIDSKTLKKLKTRQLDDF